jgi:hypothetical protein
VTGGDGNYQNWEYFGQWGVLLNSLTVYQTTGPLNTYVPGVPPPSETPWLVYNPNTGQARLVRNGFFGEISLSYTVEDGTSAVTQSNTINIALPNPIALTVDAGPDDSILDITSYTRTFGDASFSGGNGPFTIQWSVDVGSGVTITNGTTLTPTFSGLNQSLYIFRLTVTDALGNTAFDTFTLDRTVSFNFEVFCVNVGPEATIHRIVWDPNNAPAFNEYKITYTTTFEGLQTNFIDISLGYYNASVIPCEQNSVIEDISIEGSNDFFATSTVLASDPGPYNCLGDFCPDPSGGSGGSGPEEL